MQKIMVDGSIKYQETEGSIHKIAAKILERKVVMAGLTGIINPVILSNQ